MGTRRIGPYFGDELAAAGLAGLPISWGEDGIVTGRELLMAPQQAALDAVIAAHDPQRPRLGDYRSAIQAHVDATARARDYDSGVSCASWVASTNPAWAAEAQAFVAWRDSVWAHVFGELAKVETGQREQPTITGLLEELPAMAWPA